MRTSTRLTSRAAAYGFWRRCLGPVVLAAAVSAAGGAHADDSVLTWIVKSISSDEDGDIIQASAMRVPQVGTALVTGQQIATGAGQHMVLVNGRDLVEIKPNSTLIIGDDDASTPEANVSLVNGAIHVEVGKRAPGKTFAVDAPYLVATVKGTQFEVNSSSAQTSVAVSEGVVAVSSDTSGASVDVTAGKTAVVGRRNADKPKVSPTTAGGTPSTIDTDTTTESASADDGGNSGGSDSGSGGSDSGGSGSGGSNSGGSNSGGSNSGDSGGSDSGSSDSGSGGLGGAVGDATGAVGGAVGGVADGVGDAVGGATGALGDAVGGPVGDAVSGLGGAVGGAVGGVGGAVGGAVGGLGGAVGGLLGGDK